MSVKQIDGYKIKMSSCMGRGAYGSVYKGVSDTTHKQVAIKIIQKDAIDSDEYLKSALFQEIKIMQSVHNPNIVQFIDVMESSKNYYIIQELCDGDISKIMKPGVQMDQNQCINMLTQICNGFLALVREGIVHRDLKPANIMIKDKILKIGDFGFAKKIPNSNFKNKTVVGTPLYMSLQILKNQSYTSKCDIWALGFIFYELLHGTTPWTAKTEYQLIQNVSTIPLTIKRKDLKPTTVDFIKKCLALKQDDRISWDELFLHPIFNGFFNDGSVNKVFQNKLKQIMGDLRFYISSNNLDLVKILFNLGYTSENQQLDFEAYYNFLRNVNPDIKKQEALYVFKETDTDNSNSISILEIQKILNRYAISFTSTFKGVPKFQKKEQEQDQTFLKVSEQVQQRIHNCFTRLYKIIIKNKMTLQKVFNDFDKQKDGKLSENQFFKMMNKLDKTMPNEEILEAFNLIDEDGSKTIEFDELNKYYCKVNGIPYSPTQKNEPMDIQQDYLSSSQNSYNNTPKSNPLFKLQHQNSMPYYPPPPMYYPPPPMNYMPPQQPQGMFGNFIMNQLSQHMYGSGSNKNIQPW